MNKRRARFSLGKLPGGKRGIALATATVLAVISAWMEFSDPLSVSLLALDSHIRAHDSDGSVVVVGIDDKSRAELHGYPWSHSVEAQFINRAMALGAKSIGYDRTFVDAEGGSADKALIGALDHARGHVYFGTGSTQHPETGKFETLLPAPVFRGHARLGNLTVETGFDDYPVRVPRYRIINGAKVPGLGESASGEVNRDGGDFHPDYAIRVASIPTFSYVDVLDGRVPRSAIAGKAILVGAVSEMMHDDHYVPGQGVVHGVYTHALAALSLKAGRCLNIGWWPGLIVAFGAALVHLFAPRRLVRTMALALGVVLLLIVPLALAQFGISTDPASALLMLAGLAIWNALYSRSHRHAGTDLPNLAAFRQNRAVASHSIIVMQVHNFAQIISSVDALGETAIAHEIVRRLHLAAGSLTVYQTERGEYAFLSPLTPATGLGEHLEGLHSLLRQPFAVGTRVVDLHFGFGVDSSFTTSRSTTVRLSSAMVCAAETELTGARWAEYDVDRATRVDWDLRLLGDLERAVAENQVYPVYQPKVDLGTGAIIGYEALARWDHPTHGPVSPDIFIQAAENSNRIDALTWHMMRQCLTDAATLRQHGLVSTIAVNLSTRLLDDALLPGKVGEVLREFNHPPTELTLELTETGKAIIGETALGSIAALRALGVKISIDDFGAGNATMDYAHDFTVDEIKIDRKFITTLCSDVPAQTIVNSLIAMAHRLGCRVVAEGIENPQTRELLAAMGCDIGQGFGLYTPKKLSGIISLFTEPGAARQIAR